MKKNKSNVRLRDRIDTQGLKRIGNFIRRERDNRFSLAILFAAFIGIVLFISVVLIVVAVWILSSFGAIGNVEDNTSTILTLVIIGQASVLISFEIGRAHV